LSPSASRRITSVIETSGPTVDRTTKNEPSVITTTATREPRSRNVFAEAAAAVLDASAASVASVTRSLTSPIASSRNPKLFMNSPS
jgi:hypothetical protein